MATFRLARRLRAERAENELSDGQLSVLFGLRATGTHTLGELAEREHVSAPSMNRTVNCLEESGYLTRIPDTTDKRKANIQLTDAGTNVVKDTVRKRDAWLHNQFRALDHADREILAQAADLMRRLATQ
ncbi:MarR family transcriptional regulator [Mycetocola zhadangensis]|uniref:MarR family transcriptional regulator n=2 Tax=Mycetocola zhadangensis TaxID=1164595 RepID=A0A3L7ISV3_9MICO|nr:MarR family transcriptional regulator [Mycetocola zhadangensis]